MIPTTATRQDPVPPPAQRPRTSQRSAASEVCQQQQQHVIEPCEQRHLCANKAKTEIRLDGRSRAMVIAESLARVIAAIRIATFIGGHISFKNTQKLVLTNPAFAVPRFESRDWRSFV